MELERLTGLFCRPKSVPTSFAPSPSRTFPSSWRTSSRSLPPSGCRRSLAVLLPSSPRSRRLGSPLPVSTPSSPRLSVTSSGSSTGARSTSPSTSAPRRPGPSVAGSLSTSAPRRPSGKPRRTSTSPAGSTLSRLKFLFSLQLSKSDSTRVMLAC